MHCVSTSLPIAPTFIAAVFTTSWEFICNDLSLEQEIQHFNGLQNSTEFSDWLLIREVIFPTYPLGSGRLFKVAILNMSFLADLAKPVVTGGNGKCILHYNSHSSVQNHTAKMKADTLSSWSVRNAKDDQPVPVCLFTLQPHKLWTERMHCLVF